MTLAQLQSHLARLIGLQAPGDDPNVAAWMTDALNQAQLEIATDLQIPRSITTIPAVSGSFPVPGGTQSWGILAARDLTNNNPLAIVDPARRLAELGPLTTGVPSYLEYDPSAGTLVPYPVPTAPIDIELVYAVIPTDMVNPTDQPWNGAYPDYHFLVAMKAALLIHESDWADPNRIQWVMTRFSLQLRKFAKRINAGKDFKPRSEVELDDAPRA